METLLEATRRYQQVGYAVKGVLFGVAPKEGDLRWRPLVASMAKDLITAAYSHSVLPPPIPASAKQFIPFLSHILDGCFAPSCLEYFEDRRGNGIQEELEKVSHKDGLQPMLNLGANGLKSKRKAWLRTYVDFETTATASKAMLQ